MSSKVINRSLIKYLFESGKKSKVFAKEVNRSPQSLSDYTGGKPVPIDTAEKMCEVADDSELSLSVAYEFFGLIKSMDGSVYQKNPLALSVLQKKESDERKINAEQIQLILAKETKELTVEDKEALKVHVFEFSDEIIVELSYIVAVLKKVGVSLMWVVKQRMSYWIQIGYMRKD